jgi:hypothetical protein
MAAHIQKVLSEIVSLIDLFEKNPHAAADLLDQWSERFKFLASQIRQNSSLQSIGGINDRVLINVVGQDGQIKQKVES